MKRILIAVALLLAAVQAGATTIYAGAWSHHLRAGDYNENHELIAVEHRRWVVGTFVNSYGDRTHLMGRGWDFYETENLRLRVYAGATHGYRNCASDQTRSDARLCPAVVPELAFTKYRLQPAVMLFGDAVAVSFKFEI